MAAPVIGRSRRVPPKGAVVDRSHPLANRLEFCFIPALGDVDLAKGYVGVRNTGHAMTYTSTPYGLGIKMAGTSDRFTFSGVPDAGFTTNQTFLLIASMTSLPATNAFFDVVTKGTSDTTNTPIWLSWGNVNGTFPILGVTRGGSSNYRGQAYCSPGPTNNDPMVANQTYLIVGTYPNVMQGYWDQVTNGWHRPWNVTTPTGSITGTSAAVVIGSRGAKASNTILTAVAVWSRTFSEGETAALYADPFCFLRW